MVRIALVEDEDQYVEQITTYLDRYEREKDVPIKLTVYRDGDAILQDYHMQYDLILMDI